MIVISMINMNMSIIHLYLTKINRYYHVRLLIMTKYDIKYSEKRYVPESDIDPLLVKCVQEFFNSKEIYKVFNVLRFTEYRSESKFYEI